MKTNFETNWRSGGERLQTKHRPQRVAGAIGKRERCGWSSGHGGPFTAWKDSHDDAIPKSD